MGFIIKDYTVLILQIKQKLRELYSFTKATQLGRDRSKILTKFKAHFLSTTAMPLKEVFPEDLMFELSVKN